MTYSALKWLCQPYTVTLLVMGIAGVRLWRCPVAPRRWLVWGAAAYLVLILISTPVVAHFATNMLEGGYPALDIKPRSGDSIVLLSGGILRADAIRQHDELDVSAYYRCQHAASLHREASCRIIVTGGKVNPRTPGRGAAEVMRDHLVQIGVPGGSICVENASRSTRESADAVAAWFAGAPPGRVFLVTDALHMPRAAACFRRSGIEVIASPCNHRATQIHWSVLTFLPNSGALAEFHVVAH